MLLITIPLSITMLIISLFQIPIKRALKYLLLIIELLVLGFTIYYVILDYRNTIYLANISLAFISLLATLVSTGETKSRQ